MSNKINDCEDGLRNEKMKSNLKQKYLDAFNNNLQNHIPHNGNFVSNGSGSLYRPT